MRQGLIRTACQPGSWHNQWVWFAGWKTGYRSADRSAGYGLEGHGNASRRWINNVVFLTANLADDAPQNRSTSGHDGTILAPKVQANVAMMA
jgi:hypothetical protein